MKKELLFIATLLIATIVGYAQTSGGPDAYGYTWKNSNHTVAPPVYSWVDISNRGNEVSGLADDNVVGPFAVPSGFQFYWYPITQFWIGSNGYISFNGANIASPFPGIIPSPAGANDWIAPHMSDLNFAGANNPGKAYWLANNDSIIVSFVNVPYWVVGGNGYSGSHTFQIIILSADNSITFNYQSMNAGTATLPIDNAVGIENITGTLGLQTMIDVVPGNLFTIKYYYPTNVTYAVTDGGINWNNNELNGGFFIRVSNQPVTLKANVKNFGNQALGSFTVTDTIYSGTTPLSNGVATIPPLQPGEDTTVTFSNSFFSQFSSTYTFATRIQGITGDMVAVNNRKTQKIISVNTTTATYLLDYSDGFPDGAGLSWSGGNGGIGVYIEPPVYPVKIESTRFHIGANGAVPVGFSAMIYDASGPNGAPGILLDSVYVAPTNVIVGGYNLVPVQNQNVFIQSGGVYIVWYMGGENITISRDLTPPSSQRSFEILGNAWGQYRSMLTEDFLIGMEVSNLPAPVANFNIDTTAKPAVSFTDLTTNNPTSWHWDFGVNNDTSNVQNPTYTYPAYGTYTVCLTATNQYATSNTCKTFSISSGIGIDEDLLAKSFVFFPNPATDEASLTYPETMDPNSVTISFFNVFGQQIGVPYYINGNHFRLETNILQQGIYFYQVQHNGRKEPLARGKFSKM